MIYLNNAATSFPKPEGVHKAVANYLNAMPYEPTRSNMGTGASDHLQDCRRKLAGLLDVKNPRQIVITSGATESLNLAVFGLNLAGAHIITTSIEHNSLLRPLYALKNEKRIELSVVDCDSDGYVSPSTIAENIKLDTKLIAISHVSNVTGTIIDVKEICKIARDNGIISLIDASQSIGAIPVSISDIDPDLMAFAGHKALWGLPGIGGLYIREGVDLRPIKMGGIGFKSELLHQPDIMPLKYEAGTPNLPGAVALSAAIDELTRIGIENILKQTIWQRRHIIDGLSKIPKIKLYAANNNSNRVANICFNIIGMTPEEAGYILENSFGIVCRSGLHCAPLIHKALGCAPQGCIRVSPSYFTPYGEIEEFLKAVKEICLVKVPA